MILSLGTEPRSEYLRFEVAAGARKLVEQVMLVKPGEHVAITADTASDWRVVQATAEAVYAAGAVPTVLLYETRPTAVMEPPRPVGAAVAAADVWIEFAVAYVLHTEAFRKALANGCRYICLTGMDADMMVRTIAKVNYPKMLELGALLKRLIEAASIVRVTSPAGTDLRGYQKGRKVRQSGKLADTKGEAIMLGGQVSWCPIEETITGRLVFDGALWPPMELGALKEPVVLEIDQGRITRISGGSEAATFKRWLESFGDPNMFLLAHFSLGFNPGVTRITGRIVEDERVFGCIEMGIGSQGANIGGRCWKAASHTDGIVLNPTIYLDDTLLEKDGIYVHPEVVALCKELGAPGY
ncbi:MAG: aminopeptidase [Bacillota bacterium]